MAAKSTTKTIRTCYECREPMRRKTRLMEFDYKGVSVELPQPGWYCTSCDASVHSIEDIEETEQALSDFRIKVDGVLTPSGVSRIRKRLGLSQRKAGEVLGGGPRAFQKYEKGIVTVSQPMSNLLRLLDKDPTRIGEILESRKEAKPSPAKARGRKDKRALGYRAKTRKAASAKSNP